MNKLFSKIASLSVGLAMAVGVGVALGHESVREVKAADTTVTWTATAANNLGSKISAAGGTASGTVTLSDGGSNEYSLSYTRTLVNLASGKQDYVAFQGSIWIQLGSGNVLESLSFTTSAIEGVIKSVTVVAATAGTHKLTIDVGGTKYKDAASLTSYSSTASATNPNPTNCVVTGTGESSGALTITIASSATTTNKAMLIRSVSVTYETGVTPTGPFHVTYNGNGATSGSMTDSKEYESGDIVTIMACGFMRDNYSVTGWNTQADGSGTSYVLSGTFEITGNVTLYAQWEYVGPGSEDNPYTVAEAIAAIDDSSTPSPAYVSGIICQVDSYDGTHKSITYWISDDGTTTTKLEVYSGKGLNGADFAAKEDVEVGATVTVKGTLKVYKSTYEFDYNNELVSYTAPVHTDPTLSLSSVKAHLRDGGASITVTASFESFSGTPTLSVVSEPQYAYVSFDGATITIQPKAAHGTETITFRATYNSEVADKEFKLVVTTNAGTADNPLTVSEAKSVIDVMETVSSYCVLGVVSQVDNFNSSYGSITYWISGDGTTTDQLECYSSYGYDGAKFSAKEDLAVGTCVVVQGTLKIYNSVYEFDQKNKIIQFPNVDSFGLELLSRTNEVCADYDGKTDNHDAIAGIWTTLAGEGYYADLTSTEKSFLESVEGDKTGDALAQAMARYDYLTGKYELTNFISGRTPVASNYTPAVALGSDNNSYIIIVVISAVSVMSFGLALFLRKKRSK